MQYITRGMSNPKGKPKVYFSCHPADFETAFPLITEDLLRHANCAIWYEPQPGAGPEGTDAGQTVTPAGKDSGRTASAGSGEESELEEILGGMQLVVFAVSSRFLYEANRAKDLELPMALRLHIPVLPIMLENGLGYAFSNTCAKIQVVPRYGTDPTAIPYDEVLETFLQSVLVGDELAEKVRDAFDAYVFLSYRKKDRRHAQRLMRLIHENPQFRDIAIWYDEFLVPGEGFNEAIKDAFEKSSLFAMAVTPHLEEEGNYVMRVEYPMARDRRSGRSDFEIVPVEMYEPADAVEGKDWRINPDRLKEHSEFKYREITNLRDEHRIPELNRTFVEALSRIAKKENDGSAQHRFFIGLAYLNGIDVEINQEKALELLTGAALDLVPCMDATAKLADMYRNGEGVGADLGEAIRWQQLLASQYRSAWEINHDPDEHRGYGTQYFKALRKLSDMQREAGCVRDAVDIARQALDFCAQLEQEVGIREQERDKALILNRLGSLYRELGENASAEDCFGKACTIYEKQAREIGTARVRRDLSISYERLGDLCRKRDDCSGADAYYRKTKAIREELQEASASARSRRDLSAVLTKLGNVCKSRKEYAEAANYYNEALALDRVLAEEVKSPQARDDYGVSLVKTGDIHKAEDRMEEAALCYEQACGIFRENAEKTGSRIFLEHLAGGCEKLASIRKKTDRAQDAERLYAESVSLREKLYASGKTVPAAHALAVSCYNAAAYLKNREMMERAHQLWSELSTRHPEYGKYRDRAAKALFSGKT